MSTSSATPKFTMELEEQVIDSHSGKPGPASASARSYRSSYEDDAYLRRLGKRPMLNRNFGFMSILGFACSSLCSWEGILLSSVPGLMIGGPASLIWGLIFNWIGITSIYASLAELASIAPTTGGQYHWASMLAPTSWSYFLSYITAWLTTLAWQAACCSASYLFATLLQGIVVLARPAYRPEASHTVLIIWAAALLATTLNLINSRKLAKLESLILILHLAGFFGILIPMVYLSPYNDASFVFTGFTNNGLWPSQGIAFMVAYPSLASSILGADCAVHMSEEVQNAAKVVPQALMYAVTINGALATGIAIAFVFCITDLEAAVASVGTIFYPCLEVFRSATDSTVGACLMGGILLVLGFTAVIGNFASASRMLWSFARDGGLPLSSVLVKLTNNALPTNAVCVTLGTTVLLSLISLGSATSLQALLSLSVAAIYSSYIIPCTLLLWKRMTGAIRHYPGATDAIPGGLYWGPWRLPEPFGTLNNVFACCYSILTLFWSFWPMVMSPKLDTVNWSILVFGVVVIFSVGWYFLRARYYFKGPVREL